MIRLRTRTLLLAIVLVVLPFAGCAAPDTDAPPTIPPTTLVPGPDGVPTPGPDPGPDPGVLPKLIVGTEAEFFPFEFLDENGAFAGFDVDLMREAARRAGFEVEFRNLGFDVLIPSVQQGQIDAAISAMTITERRAQEVDFSIAYYEANQSMTMRSDDARGFTSLESLRGLGLVFGVQSGTTAVDIVEEEFVARNDGTLRHYQSYPLAIAALKGGDVDLVVMDEPAQRLMAEQDSAVRIAFQFSTGETYGIAVRTGRVALLDAINDALEAMLDDGTVAALKAKWEL